MGTPHGDNDSFTIHSISSAHFLKARKIILKDERRSGCSGEGCSMYEQIKMRRVVNNLGGSPTPVHPESWQQPRIDFTVPGPAAQIPTKLYLVPTIDYLAGEDETSEKDFAPIPTASEHLPEITQWVQRYVLTAVEIVGGRTPAMQLARWSHRRVFLELLEHANSRERPPKIRKIYLQEPIDGVVEGTVTLRFGERVRSLILRFEGVDQRWLCTEFKLL